MKKLFPTAFLLLSLTAAAVATDKPPAPRPPSHPTCKVPPQNNCSISPKRLCCACDAWGELFCF